MRRIHRGDIMDDYLWSLGFWRKNTAKDGSCLFRAVSEQVFHTQARHYEVRLACLYYLEKNREKYEDFVEMPFDHYLHSLRNQKEWAGQVEISALSQMYKRDFVIYKIVGQPPVQITHNDFKKKIWLCYSNGNHYDSVYPITYLVAAGIAQSIVYEVLYKDVFKMEKPVEQGLDMMSYRTPRQRKDSFTHSPEKVESPLSENPVKENGDSNNKSPESIKEVSKTEKKLEAHRGVPFPYRVAKALDPEVYRNVEFDTWLESKREQQFKDLQASQDYQFSTGDKCQVILPDHKDKVFNAHIQEIDTCKGLATVFIEELGQKHSVPIKSLKSLPQHHQQGKNYRQLSGYYQKAQIIDDTGVNSKKKNKKKKDMPVLVMSIGRGQALPPRLQNQQADNVQLLGHMANRCGNFNTRVHSPVTHFTSQPDYGKYGHPVQSKWNATDKICHRQESADLQTGGADANERKTEDTPSPSLCDIQDSESSFPALPNRGHENGHPQSYWNGCLDASNNMSGQDNKESIHSVSSPTPIPHAEGRSAHQIASPGASSALHSAPSNMSTPPHVSQQTMPANSFVASAGNFPFYPFLVNPHGDNVSGPVNYNAVPSQDPSGSDLPHGDPSTLRFFYNLGCEYYRMSSCYQIQQQQYQSGAFMNAPMFAYQSSGPQFIGPAAVPSGGMEQHVADEENPYLNGQCKREFCHQRCKLIESECSTDDDKNCGIQRLFSQEDEEAEPKHDDKCDCVCPGTPGAADSGCSSDASSGMGDGCGPSNAGTASSLGLIDSNYDSQSDSSSQRSTSNVSVAGLKISDSHSVSIDCKQINDDTDKISEHYHPQLMKPRNIHGGSNRVIRPLKEIPPRFQKMLCSNGNFFKKSHQFEGQPLVRQNSPKSKAVSVHCGGSMGANEGSSRHVFNPNAQSFIPTQGYDPSINMNSPCSNSSMYVSSPPSQQCYNVSDSSVVNPVPVESNCNPSFCSPVVVGRMTYPTYTIHISGGANGGYGSPNNSADVNVVDGSGFYANSVPSPTGYFPCSGNSSNSGGGGGQNPATVYYTMTNQGYSNQPGYTAYQQPVLYGGARGQQTYMAYSQPPPQYPMSV